MYRYRGTNRFARPLAIAAAICASVSSALAVTPAADLRNPVLLMERQGSDLIASLEKNIYGPGDHAHVLTVAPGGALFHPTDPRDHLATHYVGVPSLLGQPRAMRVDLSLGPKDDNSAGLKLIVQSDGATEIATFSPDPSDAVNGVWSTTLPVPNSARQIRLVMLSENGTVVRIPSRIKITSEKPLLPGIAIAAIGAVIIALGILVWSLLRKRAKAPAAAFQARP